MSWVYKVVLIKITPMALLLRAWYLRQSVRGTFSAMLLTPFETRAMTTTRQDDKEGQGDLETKPSTSDSLGTTVKGVLRGVVSSAREMDKQLQDVIEIISPGPLKDTNRIDPQEEARLSERRVQAREKLVKAQQLWNKIEARETYK